MRLLVLLALLAPALVSAQGTGTLAGRVFDDTGEGLPGANVRLEGTTLGAATDIDGNYRIIGVPAGTYNATASFAGFTPITETGVDIRSVYTRTLDFTLGSFPFSCDHCGLSLETPLVSLDPFVSRTISGEAIQNLPTGR